MKLMWSHYAESHKGVCLAVRIPKDCVFPICYSSKRVYTDTNIDDLIENSQKGNGKNTYDFDSLSYKQKTAMIKDKKWSYEKEYRIVVDDTVTNKHCQKKNNDVYFAAKIEKVYFGVNFDFNSDYGRNIVEICQNNKIIMVKMEMSTENYSLKKIPLDKYFVITDKTKKTVAAFSQQNNITIV